MSWMSRWLAVERAALRAHWRTDIRRGWAFGMLIAYPLCRWLGIAD